MSEKKLALQVSALCNGTVIDHIPADKLFAVVNLLNIPDMETNVTIGNNLDSKKLGKKGLIKIADKFFTDDEVNRISLVAPNVVLNTIRNYQVVDKREVKMPDKLQNIVKCSNPNCITNNEPMDTLFHLVNRKEGTLKCHYCEKEKNVKEIELL
ncbi:MAG: aspartate carbamoyltransferase regulatory subunit [Bacteroidaceae bacterium]|nr:aspartate carbamoyltransferase regulatory subunit [Bacteroidales bacterium]MBQ2878035.1 aspartate carbamoyltransferase regulatory subunit [Bacteroidaceae bacterium]MBQ3188027.1 aspartate carbamoyltransferase regulatory subunit [Bacteroidaceae bacterium]MBQ3623618.1 aspartate carbamoyltransferase regulatory subunit [Bacteroidaceae bacterium]